MCSKFIRYEVSAEEAIVCSLQPTEDPVLLREQGSLLWALLLDVSVELLNCFGSYLILRHKK